jgi:hypothetical protein
MQETGNRLAMCCQTIDKTPKVAGHVDVTALIYGWNVIVKAKTHEGDFS